MTAVVVAGVFVVLVVVAGAARSRLNRKRPEEQDTDRVDDI